MQHQPTEQEENHHASPKDPLILLRPPLNHPDRIATDPQRVANRVQLPLRILHDFSLLIQIPQHRLAPRNVIVERRVRAPKEILLPQRMLLAARVPGAQYAAVALHPPRLRQAIRPGMRYSIPSTTRSAACRRRTSSTRIRILRRTGHKRPASQQLGAVLRVHVFLALGFQRVQLRAEVVQLGPEVAHPLVGLFLLGGVELLLGEVVVFVNGPVEGG